MIVRINGVSVVDGPDFSGGAIPGAAQAAGEAFIQYCIDAMSGGAAYLIHAVTDIMPSLAVFGLIVCVSLGMFGKFTTWLARGLAIYAGGAVWIILSTTS